MVGPLPFDNREDFLKPERRVQQNPFLLPIQYFQGLGPLKSLLRRRSRESLACKAQKIPSGDFVFVEKMGKHLEYLRIR